MTVLRNRVLRNTLGWSRTTLWRHGEDPDFPEPILLATNPPGKFSRRGPRRRGLAWIEREGNISLPSRSRGDHERN